MTAVGLRSDSGVVEFALYATPESFPKRDGMIAGSRVRIADAKAVGIFSNLAPGTYAVAVYHDENDNNQFDKDLIGLPLEGFGFSNDAPAFFGPPSFAEAAVAVPAEGAAITIRMSYW
ncbi:MAG: DUF2141 domain-containing protein [Rhodospirillales bacterium]|nr:DUF2141 domain-containing protein [Rhodospirillales bacterium]